MSDRLERGAKPEERPVIPQATNPRLTAFLERLWGEDRTEGPLVIRLRQKAGRGKYYDDTIEKKDFKPGSKIPEKSEIVAISNWLITTAQQHCDSLGHSAIYGVLAENPKIDAYPYSTFLLHMRPADAFGADSEEQITIADKQRTALVGDSIAHNREFQEHLRSVFDMLTQAVGQSLQYKQMEVRELREDSRQLREANLQLLRMREEVESKRFERERLIRRDERIDFALQSGFRLVGKLVPVIGQAMQLDRAQKGDANTVRPEEMERDALQQLINHFADTPEDQQKRAAIFGYFHKTDRMIDPGDGTPEHPPIFEHVYKPGILSEAQVLLISEIVERKAHPDAAMRLMEGGDLEITADQAMGIAQFVPMEQLIALREVFEAGKKIREHRMAQQQAAAQQQPPQAEEQASS